METETHFKVQNKKIFNIDFKLKQKLCNDSIHPPSLCTQFTDTPKNLIFSADSVLLAHHLLCIAFSVLMQQSQRRRRGKIYVHIE